MFTLVQKTRIISCVINDIIILRLVQISVFKWITIVMCVINLSNLRAIKNISNQTYIEFHICKHMELTIEKPDEKNIGEIFYTYIIQHNKQYDLYFIKCHFNLVFIDNQNITCIKSNLFINKTMNSGKKYLQNVVDDF